MIAYADEIKCDSYVYISGMIKSSYYYMNNPKYLLFVARIFKIPLFIINCVIVPGRK